MTPSSRFVGKWLLTRDFGIFWAGQALSTLGDAFAFVAVPLLVLEATGSVAKMGLLTATFGAAQFITGLFSGAIVDAVDRRKLMLACDVARAMLLTVVPVAWVTGGPSITLLFLVTALGAALGNLFSVAYIAATANLVAPEQLTGANSRLQGTQALGFVLGPTLAGLVASKTGPASALWVDAASFVCSAVSLALVRLRTEPRVSSREPLVARFAAGVKFLAKHPVLRSVTVVLLLTSALDAGLLDLNIYMIKHDLGGSDATVGWVMGTGALGAVLAAVIATRVRKALGFGVLFLGGTALEAFAMMAIGVWPSLAMVVAGAIVFSAALTLRGISSMSLRQRITPDHLLGRVTAAFWTLIATMQPVGAALATKAASRYGASEVVGVAGVVIATVAGFAVLSPARQAHPEGPSANDSAPA